MDNFFVRRPIVAIVLSIFMVIIGGLSILSTPIAQYPEIAPPIVQIQTSYRGANALNVEQAVATPIEQKVNGVENMLYMQSTNTGDGSMSLSVTFDMGTDLDNATMLTQNRVASATSTLPVDVKNTGVTTKKSLSMPLLLFSIYSPNNTYDSNFLTNYANINIVDALSRIKGVGEVVIFGGSNYAMRIWVKPDFLAKYKLTIPDIMNAIKEQNSIAPSGKFGAPPAEDGNEFTYNVTLKDRLIDIEDFENIILKSNIGNQQVRLKDVATVALGTESYASKGGLNGKPAGTIGVKQMPGSNALEVAAESKRVMDELSKKFPQDLKYTTSLDTTLAITEGINEIMHTLLEAIILVIIVVFIFLQNWRATIIPLFTTRFNLYRAAEIGGTPAEGYTSAEARQALQETAEKILPADMGYEWSAMSYQEKQAEGKGATVFIMAILFVFLILAAQYESWKLPFSVLLGTPFAVFGAFLGLYLCKLFSPDYVNNVFAQICLVMLIGLAAKNAILIVEFAKAEYEKGVPLVEASLNAAKLRLRPILMTAFAFILGVVPLLTASGAGAQARKVMGMTVFSGMLVATVMGVCFIPVLFVFVERFGKKKHLENSVESTKSISHEE